VVIMLGAMHTLPDNRCWPCEIYCLGIPDVD
jgi:hypothetical protein